MDKSIWKPRPYQASDREACLRILDGNSPQSFLPNERESFSKYLDEHAAGYYVVENAKGILAACGGFSLGLDGESATLCWGMVDKAFHGKGLGRLLLSRRLAALAQIPGMKLVRMDTSQNSVGFFMKRGFKTYRITRDHYGPDLHRYEMYLLLDEENRKEILNFNF